MIPQTHCITSPSIPSMFLTTTQFPSPHPKTISFSTTFSPLPVTKSTHFRPSKKNPCLRSVFQAPRCSISVAEIAPKEDLLTKPSPAEVSRTIMELSSVGTLSTLAQDGWPLGIGVRFVVDEEGTPILCLNASNQQFSVDDRCSLHVQLEQCGTRTPQCTLQGNLNKAEDGLTLKDQVSGRCRRRALSRVDCFLSRFRHKNGSLRSLFCSLILVIINASCGIIV
eukprot:TRINITY_DN40423_c0_g1_i1.p1 TRINITY_DN40423_c0_g1~~TRINITY_DN40423_c0_g1_i1.p1  ORF type:complete len:224 (+),score=26.43 TRINITY_DN40423_c0_g1_i1:397-1068(+)